MKYPPWYIFLSVHFPAHPSDIHLSLGWSLHSRPGFAFEATCSPPAASWHSSSESSTAYADRRCSGTILVKPGLKLIPATAPIQRSLYVSCRLGRSACFLRRWAVLLCDVSLMGIFLATGCSVFAPPSLAPYCGSAITLQINVLFIPATPCGPRRTSWSVAASPRPLPLSGGWCYKPLFFVAGLVGALSLGNKSMADLNGIRGNKSSVAQNRIPSQRLLLRLTTEELF